MWLILCERFDTVALWVYEGLKARGVNPLEMIVADSLSYLTVWDHRIATAGVTVEVILPDGRRIHSDMLRGVINRLVRVPMDATVLIHPSEYDYVYHELNAFFLSWLYALPQPVLNRPKPRGLAGVSPHISEWIWLAARAGLSTHDYVYSPQNHLWIDDGYHSRSHTVFVVDGQLIGPTPSSAIRRSCIRLATLAGTDVLGIDFVTAPESDWIFKGATAYPDLRKGGTAMLDTLAMVLRNGPRIDT